MRKFAAIRLSFAFMLLIGAAGCTVHPRGEGEERAAAFAAGQPFEAPIEHREITPLSENPSPEQLVEYALLNNADLEQKYWTWRAAIEQIPQDGTQSTTLNLSAGTIITNGKTGWNSSTIALSNDPMTDIKWPSKLGTAAQKALEDARAAGHRFFKSKYDLRSKVLSAYYDYAQTAELIRLEQSNNQLLKMVASTTSARNRAGNAGQQDVMKANNEVDLSDNEIATMRSQLIRQRAALNALLNREPAATLTEPLAFPAPALFSSTDSELIDQAAKSNPELLALSDEIRGRQDGIELAKLQYIPDFNLSVGTDLAGMAQSILGQATIPAFRYEALAAATAQAEDNLRAAEASFHDARNGIAAMVIADIITIRDADRQIDLLQNTILPRANQIVLISQSSYEAGRASLTEQLESQRSTLAIKRLILDLNAARAKRISSLEANLVTVLPTQGR